MCLGGAAGVTCDDQRDLLAARTDALITVTDAADAWATTALLAASAADTWSFTVRRGQQPLTPGAPRRPASATARHADSPSATGALARASQRGQVDDGLGERDLRRPIRRPAPMTRIAGIAKQPSALRGIHPRRTAGAGFVRASLGPCVRQPPSIATIRSPIVQLDRAVASREPDSARSRGTVRGTN